MSNMTPQQLVDNVVAMGPTVLMRGMQLRRPIKIGWRLLETTLYDNGRWWLTL